jgi:TonB family protein
VSPREQTLQTATASDPRNVANWIELAGLQEERRAYGAAERTFKAALDATGAPRELLTAAAGFFNRIGQFELAIGALEQIAASNPVDVDAQQLVTVYYFEKAYRDGRLAADDKRKYVDAGLASSDRALNVKQDYVEALTYKNLLLRLKADIETDSVRRDALLAEADALRARAIELNKARTSSGAPTAAWTGAPPPPPPPGYWQTDGPPPIRVGGNVKTPAKIRDVRPVYPQEALDAGVSGVVILEVVIDSLGLVKSVRVLRSIPLLDQAALDAVRQWQFTPTLLNGVAVPVIMTVTVNFTQQR